MSELEIHKFVEELNQLQLSTSPLYVNWRLQQDRKNRKIAQCASYGFSGTPTLSLHYMSWCRQQNRQRRARQLARKAALLFGYGNIHIMSTSSDNADNQHAASG